MSLVDALLQEPFRDPSELWIALRTDGVAGSGTIDDPYDGGTRIGPTMAATLSFDRRDFIAFTSGPHQLAVGNNVRISNVAFPMGPSFNTLDTAHDATVTEIISALEFKAQLTNLEATPSPGPPTPALQTYTSVTKTVGSDPLNITQAARLYWPIAKVTSTGHGLVRYDATSIAGAADPLFGAVRGGVHQGQRSLRGAHQPARFDQCWPELYLRQGSASL